jgi:hypothetical protein
MINDIATETGKSINSGAEPEFERYEKAGARTRKVGFEQ